MGKKQALKNNVKRINRDELRVMLDSSDSKKSKFRRNNEKFIIKIRDVILQQALYEIKTVIIDDTNLRKSIITEIKNIVDKHNKLVLSNQYEVIIKEFDVDVVECIRRDSLRNGN